MNGSFSTRIVSSLIWIACGILVVVIRAFIVQTTSLFAWEILGAAMSGYGVVRLSWGLVKYRSAESPMP